MQMLLGVRSTVLGVIEQARGGKYVWLSSMQRFMSLKLFPCRLLKSSLEAQVDIIMPHGVETSALALLQRESMCSTLHPLHIHRLMHSTEDFLKTLFIVSEVVVCDEVTLDKSPTEWVFTDTLSLPGNSNCVPFPFFRANLLVVDCKKDVTVRVHPSSLDKCPRCWTFTRHEHHTLCQRCANVLKK